MNQSNPQDRRMIIRANHDAQNRFFLIRRATAQDKRLTSRARGVLCYLLSKPDGWEVSIQNLKREFPDLGRDAAYQCINELIATGYAARVQVRDEKTGKLGNVRIDIHEMPLPEKPDTASPDTASPDTASPDTAKPEHIRNRVPEETEQQKIQSSSSKDKTDAAAAASAFSFDQIKAYVLATKPHSKNAGGLAKYLERTGEEDALIREWLDAQNHRKSENLNRTPFDAWTRQQTELAAREREQAWLDSLPAITRQRMFEEAAEEFAKRCPNHARGNWKETFKGGIEKMIIAKYYEEEIAA